MQPLFRSAAALALLLCAAAPATSGAARAAGSKSGADPTPLAVKEVVDLEEAGSFDISPDGLRAVWVRTASDRDKNVRIGQIRLSSLADTAQVAVTRMDDGAGSPLFSPDGSLIAFLAAEGGKKAQIWLYDTRGGAPRALTSLEQGVSSFEWRSAGEIIFAAAEDSTFRERGLAKKKDDVIVAADQERYRPVRLFSVETATGRIRRLTGNPGVVTEFAVSPDGGRAVYAVNVSVDYQYDHRERPRQYLLDLISGASSEICAEPFVDPHGFVWDETGEGIYCSRAVASDSTDDYVSISHLYRFDPASGALEPVTRFWENGLGMGGGGYAVTRDGVVAALADGARNRIAVIRRSGKRFSHRFIEPPDGLQMRLHAAERGGDRIVCELSSASRPPRLVTALLRGGKLRDVRELAVLNEHLQEKILARSEVASWTGARGDRVEGLLFYPDGYTPGTRYPLMISLHGGPSGVDLDAFSERWAEYPHLLSATRGVFILTVNYHGSGNYGLEWIESIRGKYYELEVPDILAGVEMMIERGMADPERLGIMGWSNGSILAIATCLRDKRFKVLLAGAGDVNWTSDYGNCAFGAGFDNAYFGGPPWEIPETYMEKSPLFRMHELRTPTLIMFGSQDTSVPTGQGWEHFRAMQQSRAAPVRFILFPGAGHGPGKLSHRERKMNEELAWLDRWLLGKEPEGDKRFDDGAPLALALKKAGVERSVGLLGSLENGVLVPETVDLKGFRIGRFEVTRAQYAAFDTTCRYPAGTGNWPATGMDVERARGYCRWLSEKTGRAFELPTAAEFDSLTAASGCDPAKENTLDWWAGYAPTPD
ncbi:MAG: prolyl oligopeptidase family serine peptidase, partial [Candidatus Krumholzibacteria bacterium]|nr:prolyl oligopeptidase family serine peptidase [Candidatus Krumholzibacteria bacterium]